MQKNNAQLPLDYIFQC